MLLTFFEYSHCAICLPANAGKPNLTAASFSSSGVFPSNFSFISPWILALSKFSKINRRNLSYFDNFAKRQWTYCPIFNN